MEQHLVALPNWAVSVFVTGALSIMSTLAYAFWKFADRLMARDDLHDKRINGLDTRVSKLEAQRERPL